MPNYKSAISPETLAVEVTRPSLGGQFSNPVAQFVTRDKTNPNRTLSTSVHVGRKDALLAAADLIELAGLDSDPLGDVVTELRKQAYRADLVDLSRGDFVRLTSVPGGIDEQYVGSIAVVVSRTSENRRTVVVTLPSMGEQGHILIERKHLGNPLDYDDDGEKLIIG